MDPIGRVRRIVDGFEPATHGLADDFVLTRLTGMKGCGCKVPREVLLELLKSFGQDSAAPSSSEEIGIGLDSCVIPLRHKGLSLVQTTDFFYPLVDDPYIMGLITTANVLSDLYAMGVAECDNMLMLLGVAVDLSESERDVVVSQFIRGFKDQAEYAGTKVRGGQTVRCPWLLLGGVGTSVVADVDLLDVSCAQPGDVLLLTKPLGCQVAVNAYEWLKKKDERVQTLGLDEKSIVTAFQQACEQMSRLNRSAASMLGEFEAHASTDVTGFGILGHADNLARHQKSPVNFVIDRMPVIEYTDVVAKKAIEAGGEGFRLFKGTSAETSGGLLVALSQENAQKLMAEIKRRNVEAIEVDSWIIGRVIRRADDETTNGAFLADDVTIESVPFPAFRLAEFP